MELDELHVDQLGTGLVGQRLTVAAVLPRVRGHLERLADAAGRKHDRLGREDDRVPCGSPVPERAARSVRAHHQPVDGALHVDLDTERDSVVLERPDHLEAGPVADMGEAGVRVTTERPLQDAPVRGAVEDGPPQLELANTIGGLQRMELGHLRVVQQLAADHRVAEMDLPRV